MKDNWAKVCLFVALILLFWSYGSKKSAVAEAQQHGYDAGYSDGYTKCEDDINVNLVQEEYYEMGYKDAMREFENYKEDHPGNEQEIFDYGYEEGYAAADLEHYDDKDEGYAVGYVDGYEEGYNDAKNGRKYDP